MCSCSSVKQRWNMERESESLQRPAIMDSFECAGNSNCNWLANGGVALAESAGLFIIAELDN